MAVQEDAYALLLGQDGLRLLVSETKVATHDAIIILCSGHRRQIYHRASKIKFFDIACNTTYIPRTFCVGMELEVKKVGGPCIFSLTIQFPTGHMLVEKWNGGIVLIQHRFTFLGERRIFFKPQQNWTRSYSAAP